MIYYNANANMLDTAKIVQNVLFKLDNALQTQGIQGYTVNCITFDVASMKSVYQISHIGYPVEVLFYNGTNHSKDSSMTFTYGKVSDIFAQTNLTPQQKESEIDRQIEETNTSIAMMLYDQIKSHQVLKSFEKIVHDKYVVAKNFPSPERMWEEFKAYYEAVKSVSSPIPFPCTIDDWWNHLEHNIKKNTAFWNYAITKDASYRVNYGLEKRDYYDPDHFTVCSDMYDEYSVGENEDQDSVGTRVEHISNAFGNELNGIPHLNNSIPMAI